jgi:hypothetical protein
MAMAMQSKPGPMLAMEAGTRTRIYECPPKRLRAPQIRRVNWLTASEP